MKKLWLYLHFPNLQLDSLPSEQSQVPTIVLDGKRNQTTQCNSLAYEQGVQLGMGLGTASALASNLQVIPYNPDIENNKINEIADSLYQLTSDINLQTPNGILLRCHNMLAFYGGLSAYWQAIQENLKQLDLQYQFATGGTPFAAKLLAKSQFNHVTDDAEQLKNALLQRPLEQTELAFKTVEKLKRVGIRKVAELAKIPLSDIAKRFDIDLVTYMGRMLGELHHNVRFYHPEKKFNRRIELLYEIDNTEVLIHPLKHLLSGLEHFLKIRDQLTEKLIISLQQREQATLTFDLEAAQGEYQAQQWQSLLRLKLETLTLSAPVYAISLQTGATFIRTPDKQDLFAGKQGALSEAQFISQLQAKLGNDNVRSLLLNNDFRPELSSAYGSAHAQAHSVALLQKDRPALLLSTPEVLTEQVTINSGPERISFGWWDAHPVLRDYFIARTQTGRWYWVYRDQQQRWFLHGVFS